METTTLRIIAGNLRTRKIQFKVDPRTRPMKDRTREAVMSLLGGTFEDAIAFDLFGGTGVLAFETVSRGASRGIVFEILKSACREILTNSVSLGISDKIEVVQSDVLDWTESLAANCVRFALPPNERWIVFCCPPYSLWTSHGPRLTKLVETWWNAAPRGSLFAIELDESTPATFLPRYQDGTGKYDLSEMIDWDVRSYKPAQMAVAEKT
ncbi:MAG: RsmD family RNA methyltransferase [Pirellula sp.]